jgi:hypothetical protein
MAPEQTHGGRTPNSASDLLDDGDNDASTDQEASPAPTESAPAPATTKDTSRDVIAENIDPTAQEQGESPSQETKLSIAAVLAIVESIVKRKHSHEDNSDEDIAAIVHCEIDTYYDHEQGHHENLALVPHAESSGNNYSLLIDAIHREGGLVEEDQMAPYQDAAYGEQPPMFLLDGETTKSNPTNVDYKPEKKHIPFQAQDSQDKEEEHDNFVAELGVSPQSHSQYFRRKRYKLPIRILHTEYCQVCLVVTG